jgi:hypothetical protein
VCCLLWRFERAREPGINNRKKDEEEGRERQCERMRKARNQAQVGQRLY